MTVIRWTRCRNCPDVLPVLPFAIKILPPRGKMPQGRYPLDIPIYVEWQKLDPITADIIYYSI